MNGKIAITGPESTGKSWLSRNLAENLGGHWVPEYAREYIEALGRPYEYPDLLRIAMGQKGLEMAAVSLNPEWLFCDTELIVVKIWSMHKYGNCDSWILDRIQQSDYDLYLLCDIDLPWEPDTQREHPHLRAWFFEWYKKELEAYGFPYRIISGNGPVRLQRAIRAVSEFFGSWPESSNRTPC